MKLTGMKPEIPLYPMDDNNKKLVALTHPLEYKNPTASARYDLVVIGAGTAGIVSAGGAALLGGTSALIEKNYLGGDCLVTGCVPSKALIRAAHVAAELHNAHRFGIRIQGFVKIDFSAVMNYVRSTRAQISEHDSVESIRKYGTDIFFGDARFEAPGKISVNGEILNYKKAVIATGARPAIPTIEGLEEAGYITNETVFNLEELPQKIAVIGGGPVGCEMAQAFRRLGSDVVLFHNKDHILDREDSDAAEILQNQFLKEGIELKLNSKIIGIDLLNGRKVLKYVLHDKEEQTEVNEILIGAGRAPNIVGLQLEAVGVKFDKNGVFVNDRLQTTNSHIYAAGDVCMNWKFTHAAEAAGRMVVQNALFGRRISLRKLIMPWCTYTEPQIAHVGYFAKDALERGIKVRTFVRAMKDVDRAVTDSEPEGFVKVHVKEGTDKILGATIVSKNAGDLITEITTAMVSGKGLKTITSVIHPYPTRSEAIRHISDLYNLARFNGYKKKVLQAWLRILR
jgi:pyruvate/2-oxoglutarate dehydrogenase complex dihydrolipoamide dehydrogenase (E3) component